MALAISQMVNNCHWMVGYLSVLTIALKTIIMYFFANFFEMFDAIFVFLVVHEGLVNNLI